MMRLPTSIALAFVLHLAARGESEKPRDITGRAWDAFNSGRYEEGLAMIDKTLAGLEAKAKSEAATMRGFDAKAREWDHAAVNTAGTLSLIRARIFEKQARLEEALAAYQQTAVDYPFAQARDPGGWFWHPGEDARKRAYMCLLRAGVKARQLPAPLFPEKEDAIDFPAERTGTLWFAGELLTANDFEGLEFLAGSARRLRIRFSNGEWMLHAIYLGIKTPSPAPRSDADWESWHARFGKWQEAVPKSVTAKIGEAASLIDYAWNARGSGYADTVTPQAWALFEARVTEAARLLRTTPRDCPEWYEQMLTVALAQGWPLDAYNKIFQQGWEAFPDYSPLVETKTYYLLPRWHGAPGDWQRFAAEFAHAFGAEHYVTAVRYASFIEGDTAFQGIDTDLLRRGWERKIEERPGSLVLLHGCAQSLRRSKDAHAVEWLEKLGETYQAEIWTSYAQLEEARNPAH